MGMLQTAPSLAVPLRLAVGVGAGGLALLAMDAAMARLDEGETPPSVAAGVLTGRPPEDAPERLASVVHYLAGLLTGPLFVWLLLTAEALLGGPSTAATVAATVYALMVAFFVAVVLPRSRVAGQRLGAIRRDWAVSAAAYLLVLVPVVHLASVALA